jgi:hypothetical protein
MRQKSCVSHFWEIIPWPHPRNCGIKSDVPVNLLHKQDRIAEFAVLHGGSRGERHGGPPRLLERVSQTLACDLPGRPSPASSQSEKTRFHQINRKTGNGLRQQMVGLF